jgi:hypothetical protein
LKEVSPQEVFGHQQRSGKVIRFDLAHICGF